MISQAFRLNLAGAATLANQWDREKHRNAIFSAPEILPHIRQNCKPFGPAAEFYWSRCVFCRAIAQLVEHGPLKPVVVGSNPTCPSNTFPGRSIHRMSVFRSGVSGLFGDALSRWRFPQTDAFPGSAASCGANKAKGDSDKDFRRGAPPLKPALGSSGLHKPAHSNGAQGRAQTGRHRIFIHQFKAHSTSAGPLRAGLMSQNCSKSCQVNGTTPRTVRWPNWNEIRGPEYS